MFPQRILSEETHDEPGWCADDRKNDEQDDARHYEPKNHGDEHPDPEHRPKCSGHIPGGQQNQQPGSHWCPGNQRTGEPRPIQQIAGNQRADSREHTAEPANRKVRGVDVFDFVQKGIHEAKDTLCLW